MAIQAGQTLLHYRLVEQIGEGGMGVGKPRVLFRGDYGAAPLSGHQHYDISNDGERFLMVRHGDASGPSRVDVVLHWSETLRQIE